MSKKSHTFLVQFKRKNSSWCFSYRYWLALHVFSFLILAFLRLWLFFLTFFWIFSGFSPSRILLANSPLQLGSENWFKAFLEAKMSSFHMNPIPALHFPVKCHFTWCFREKNAKFQKFAWKTYSGLFHIITWCEQDDATWWYFLAFSISFTPNLHEYAFYWMISTENALENGQVDAALTKSILRKVKIWGVFWPY